LGRGRSVGEVHTEAVRNADRADRTQARRNVISSADVVLDAAEPAARSTAAAQHALVRQHEELNADPVIQRAIAAADERTRRAAEDELDRTRRRAAGWSADW
jgi:hypothetical protein